MVRELIEREAASVRGAIHVVREWVHPTRVMKLPEFDWPVDDQGRAVDEPERPAGRSEEGRPATS